MEAKIEGAEAAAPLVASAAAASAVKEAAAAAAPQAAAAATAVASDEEAAAKAAAEKEVRHSMVHCNHLSTKTFNVQRLQCIFLSASQPTLGLLQTWLLRKRCTSFRSASLDFVFYPHSQHLIINLSAP